MFRVRWEDSALNELAALWTKADPGLRSTITSATSQVDRLLETDPFGQSESRPEECRILFAAPLGAIFQIEPDGRTVSVLRVWSFRQRGR